MHAMIRTAILAASTLMLATPAAAQSTTQDELQERYDRALAAGYKALMLCGAIGNGEWFGGRRTADSVHNWELAGGQSPINAIIADLPYEIVRNEEGVLNFVAVQWAENMPPRLAKFRRGHGCDTQPIGMSSEEIGSNPDRRRRTGAVWHPLSNAALSPVMDSAFEGGFGEGTRTTVVQVRVDGEEVFSRYAPDFGLLTPQRTWSVAKSIAATLVGAAVYREHVDVSQSAGLGESDSDPRRAITIDDALRMASGRYSDTAGSRTDPLYYGGATVDEVAIDWPLVHEPGSVFRYANNDTLAAVQAIEHTFDEYPPAAMFADIYMQNTVAETDWQGNFILSSQVWSTARDLARLGQLYLNNGVAEDGTRILPENWLEYVSTPSGPQPDGPLGYGASWWLMNKSEGIPPDTIAALGNRGQILVVVPSRDIVIVRRGEDPVGSRFDFISFTRDVLAALEE